VCRFLSTSCRYLPARLGVTDAFFQGIADLLEHTSLFSNLVIKDDVNVHLDSELDSHTVRFCQLLEVHGFVQHVALTPTHRAGHLLDVFMTRSEQTVLSVSVDPLMPSDQLPITAVMQVCVPRYCERFVVVGERSIMTCLLMLCGILC
jgi:hypothetical protein